jgi:hypothetical protein
MKEMTRLVSVSTIALALVCACLPVGAQQPIPIAVDPNRTEPPPPAAQGGLQEKPLTPLEERERRIRQFDPTAPREPVQLDRIPPVPGDQPPSASTPAQAPVPEESKPLEGSVAASRQRNRTQTTGPRVADGSAESPTDEEYTGPAVLTRAYTLQRSQLPQQIKWQYSAGFGEVYDSGNSFLNIQQNPGVVGRIGQQYSWTLTGRQVRRKDIFGINYVGSYNQTPAQNLRGLNHQISADYGRTLTRRIKFNLVVGGSILTQGYSLQNPITNPTNSLADVNISASPIVQLFDTTTRQVSVTPSLQWQKSARLSMSFSGGWFAVERDGFGLIGQTGYQAQSDINYRITKRTTVGAYYSATMYRYSHGVAVSDSNGTGLIFSTSLDRSTQLRLRGGLSFFENEGLAQVKIDPELAKLLGTSVGIIDQYRSNTYTEFSGELARDLHRNKTATVSFSRALAPGNGLILASIQNAAGAGVNVRAFRTYQANLGVGWSSLSSGVQTAGKYDSQYVYLALSRPVSRRASSNLRFEYRKFTIDSATTPDLKPNQFRVSLGILFNSPEGHLKPW